MHYNDDYNTSILLVNSYTEPALNEWKPTEDEDCLWSCNIHVPNVKGEQVWRTVKFYPKRICVVHLNSKKEVLDSVDLYSCNCCVINPHNIKLAFEKLQNLIVNLREKMVFLRKECEVARESKKLCAGQLQMACVEYKSHLVGSTNSLTKIACGIEYDSGKLTIYHDGRVIYKANNIEINDIMTYGRGLIYDSMFGKVFVKSEYEKNFKVYVEMTRPDDA